MSSTVKRRGKQSPQNGYQEDDLPRSRAIYRHPPRKGGKLFWLALLLYTGFLGWFATAKFFEVSPVKHTGYDEAGTAVFSETEARKTIRVFTDIGLRVVGTKQEAITKDYILEKLYEYRNASISNPNLPVFEIDVQLADGSHRFDMMGQTVVKAYSNITNIVVRLSCGPTCNENAVLLNSHFDSTVVSPGASDDGVGVAIMLELARIFAHRTTPLKNAVILLWNGAEESLNDASHAFITQHTWKDSVRAVLNLEAMGQSGKEILFQANSPELVEAYSHVPSPHGSVVSNDIFRSGLILSDTDYRQFLEHGKNVAALDMAFYQNSYLYHTMLDVEETIQPGAVQHFGDNVHAVLEYLLSNADLTNLKSDADIIFFDLFGLKFVHYSWASAVKIHYGIAIISLLVLSLNFIRLQAGPGSCLKAFVATFWSFIGAILAPILLGASLIVAGRTMTWFAAEWYPFALFGPLSVAAMAWIQLLVGRSQSHSHADAAAIAKKERPTSDLSAGSDADAERVVFICTQLLLTIFLSLTTYVRLGSSYLFSFYVGFMLIGNILDILTTPSAARSKSLVTAHINGLTYFISITPFAATTVLSWGGMCLFVPVTGRIGADTPVDVIIAAVSGVLCFMQSYWVLPLVHRVDRKTLKNGVVGLILLSLAVLSGLLRFGKVYDDMHPKRLFVEFKENVATGARELLIAQADPALMPNVLANVEKELGVRPVRRSSAETDADWANIYPFSHFIESYSFDLSHIPPPTPQAHPAPVLTVHGETYDAVTDVRTFTVRCQAPHHIWAVFTFWADVVDWSLNERAFLQEPATQPPPPGRVGKRHVIRHAGGYGSEIWEFSLSVKGKEKIKMQVNALERDGYHELVDVQKKLDGSKPKVGRTWTWSDRWGSAMILERVEKAVPSWTSGLFVGVVVSEVDV